MDIEEITEAVNEIKTVATTQIKKTQDDLENFKKEFTNYLAKSQRPGAGGDGKGPTAEQIEHKQAFDNFLRRGATENLVELQRKAMNSTTDNEGGYLVLAEMEAEVDRIAEAQSAIPRLARAVKISSASWKKRVKTSGMSMRRVADGSGSGETTEPRYAQIEVPVRTAEVEPWVNNETLEDADIDLEADLALEAGIAFAEGAGSEFINGVGVDGARGILQYDKVANASWSFGKVGYIASGKSAAFASVAPADKLIDLQHALKPKYRKGAVWLMNDATLGIVRQLKDGSGSYYLFQADPTGEFVGRLLGHPVEVDDSMPDISAGSYSVAFANFQRAYAVVTRTGMTVIRDPFTTKGVTKFNFRRRFGGGIFGFEAIKLMKFATS